MRAVRRFLPLAVAGLASVALLPTLDGEFLNWDDDTYLVNNQAYRGLGGEQLHWMFTTMLLGHYAPLTWLTLGLNYTFVGMKPWGYHLVNLLLHTANVGLFYLAAEQLLRAAAAGTSPARPGIPGRAIAGPVAAGAALAALIFGVHPLRVEPVAWLTDRGTLLSASFYLLAVLGYLRAVADGGAIRWKWWGAASLAAFAAALLSKGVAMSLPVTLLVLDAYPLARRQLGWARLLVEKVPYLALALVGAAVALIARTQGAQWTSYGHHGLEARIAFAGYSLWFYPWKLVWPVGLSPLYELPPRASPFEGRFLVAIVGVLLITALLVALRRRVPGGLAAWAHSAVAVAPVSGIVHSGNQLVADRYSYLAGLGFAVLAGYGLMWTLQLRQRGGLRGGVVSAVVGTAVLLVAALDVGTWQQSQVWRDSETLWRWAIELSPDCPICSNNLASAIMGGPSVTPRRAQEAEALSRKAIGLRPEHDSAYITLGGILALQNRDDEAAAAFRRALLISPTRVGALANLGALEARHGRYLEAIPLLRSAYSRRPEFPGLRANLGYALRNRGVELARGGKLAEATALLQQAAGLLPDDADVHRNLGLALLEQGRADEAGASLRRAAALAPGDPMLRRLLDHPLPKRQ